MHTAMRLLTTFYILPTFYPQSSGTPGSLISQAVYHTFHIVNKRLPWNYDPPSRDTVQVCNKDTQLT